MSIALRHALGKERPGIWLPKRATTASTPVAPTVLRNDKFTGTLATNLETHTADTGEAWAVSPAGQASNTHQLSGTGTVYRVASPQPYMLGNALAVANADVACILDVKSLIASDLFICYGRSTTDSTNCYRAYVTQTAVNLDKLIANGVTALGTWANALTTGTHTLTLVMTGTSISVKWDAVTVIAPVTDTTYQSAGKIGLRVGGTVNPQSATTGIHCNEFTATG